MSLEELQRAVDVRLACVEASLTQVEEHRARLHDNAHKIKDTIREVVDRQVVALRTRERQLVRQVEVVTTHQACLVATQQAGLVHCQGALTATRDLLTRCSPADAHTLAKVKLEDTPRGVACPVKLVSVQLDDAGVSGAIAALGQVQLPDTITHHPSPVIPARVEDYEDEEHDVLHKSVAPTSGHHVTVTFPRLANTWLAQCRASPQPPLATSTPQVSGKMMEGQDKRGDIASWLSTLHLAQEDEEPPTPASLDARSVRTSECSSIEIVPSHFDSDKDDNSVNNLGLCEIENVHQFIGDKSRWLRAEKLTLDQITVSSACQANEKCSAFSKCLFQNNCGESAMEKAQQSINYRARMNRKRALSDSAEEVLGHMANILASENSQWLLKDAVNSSVLPKPVKRAMYQLPSDMWLKRSEDTSAPKSCNSPKIVMATHSNTWLLHKLKECRENVRETKVDADSSENEKNSIITTKDLANALEKASTPISVGKFSPASNATTWLLTNKEDYSTETLDNKVIEQNNDNKKRWLVYSNLNTSMACGRDKSPPPLPGPVLAVAQAGLNEWLLKRI